MSKLSDQLPQNSFQSIVEIMPIAIMISRWVDGSFLYANPAASQLFNLPIAIILQEKRAGFYTNISEYQALQQQFEQGGKLQNYELLCQQPDGVNFWVNLSLKLFNFEGEKAILHTFNQINDYKQIEASLQEKESLLQVVLDNIPQLIFWKDCNSVFLGCNQKFAKTMGLNHPNEVVGKIHQDLSNNYYSIAHYIEQDHQIIATGKPQFNIIEHHIKPNGEEIWLDINKVPIYHPQGQIIGILATIQDISEQEQAKLATQQATDQLYAVLDAVPGFVSWVDAQGRYLGVNQHLANYYGLSPESFLMRELGFLEGDSQFSDLIREFLISPNYKASQIVEIPLVGGNRSYLIAAQKYQQGKAAVSVGIDITELKLMEKALLQSEARNRAFLNAIPDLILRINQDGIYLDVVEAKEVRMISYTENRIGKTLDEVLPVDLVQQYKYYINLAIETGETQELEYQIAIDNYCKDYETRVVKSGDQEAILIVRDITDRKIALRECQIAEEALRIAEENYRSIFENALEGIFQSSPEGRFINVNPALAKIYGYASPTEMIESITNIGDQLYVDPEKRDEFRALLEKESTLKDFEYRCYCKDGGIVWVQIDARVVKDSNGKLLYYEGIVQDISDRKRREDELRKKLEELKIEIDQTKRQKEVAMLTESSYFQEVQQEIAEINLDEFWS